MREKIQRFMIGRYGVDELNQFLSRTMIVIVILELIIRARWLNLLFWLVTFVLFYRTLSRDYGKRQQENQKFLTVRYQWRTKWYQITKGKKLPKFNMAKLKREIEQRQKYHIYRCPSCAQKIRIPRGKGKIAVRCPKCAIEFIKHS